jgi:hypothetical protein
LNRAPTRIDILGKARISRDNAGLLFSLIAGSAVGVTVAGSNDGFQATFLSLLTISSLVLLPICAKRSGYRVALGIAVITIPTLMVTFLSRPMFTLTSPEGIGIVLWGLTQIAVARFAYAAYTENKILQADGYSPETSREQADILRLARLEADVKVGSSSLEEEHNRKLLVA